MGNSENKLDVNSDEVLSKLPEYLDAARFSEAKELAGRILNSPESNTRARWNASFFLLLYKHFTRESKGIKHVYEEVEQLYPEKKPATASRDYFIITARIIAELHGVGEGPERDRAWEELEKQRDKRSLNPLIQMVSEWAFYRDDRELLAFATGNLVINRESESDQYEYHRCNFFLSLIRGDSAMQDLKRMIETVKIPLQSYELGQLLIPLALDEDAITEAEAETLRNWLTNEG